MRTKNSWGTVIYDKKRHAYRARYQNPHKPGAVVQRVFADRLTAQGWLAKEKQLVEADKAGLDIWTHPSEREAEAKARNARTSTVFKDYAAEYVENWRRKDGQPFAEATKRKHREYLAHLLKAPFVGKAVTSITETDIHRWLDTPMDPTPRLRAFQLLKDVMRKAEREGLIEKSPVTMRNPKLPRSKQAQIPVATPQELKIIYENMPEYCRIACTWARVSTCASTRCARYRSVISTSTAVCCTSVTAWARARATKDTVGSRRPRPNQAQRTCRFQTCWCR